LLRGAGDESYLIAQAVYLLAASMCVSTQVRDGRPVKEDEATQGHECLLVKPENTYVLEERSDRHHTMWHLSQLGNVDTVTALVGWGYVSRGAIPGLWDILPHKKNDNIVSYCVSAYRSNRR
jgi:hypothetical protein